MKIQIQMLNAYSDIVHRHTMDIPEDPYDDIENALIKLLRHSWALGVGDSIKIVEL